MALGMIGYENEAALRDSLATALPSATAKDECVWAIYLYELLTFLNGVSAVSHEWLFSRKLESMHEGTFSPGNMMMGICGLFLLRFFLPSGLNVFFSLAVVCTFSSFMLSTFFFFLHAFLACAQHSSSCSLPLQHSSWLSFDDIFSAARIFCVFCIGSVACIAPGRRFTLALRLGICIFDFVSSIGFDGCVLEATVTILAFPQRSGSDWSCALVVLRWGSTIW